MSNGVRSIESDPSRFQPTSAPRPTGGEHRTPLRLRCRGWLRGNRTTNRAGCCRGPLLTSTHTMANSQIHRPFYLALVTAFHVWKTSLWRDP